MQFLPSTCPLLQTAQGQPEVLSKTAVGPQERSHPPLGKIRLWGLGGGS